MKLSQIKLSGFKSFVDHTSIDIKGQLVGVVGPNGCGKSNIIDAVRWVLGESSAKQLRGKSMQDVIFNGSVKRKAVSRATVELVFDNTAKTLSGLWNTYDEISIKRLISRSGDSFYYINNQVVRRRDITDLFLGTGVGSHGYAVIEQGMISRIIEAHPEDLRLYLEEAAGVSKYREKRRETLNRLQDTRDNLVRIEDIKDGLLKQLELLSTQAEIATRYQELNRELKQKQLLQILIKSDKSEQLLSNIDKDIVGQESKLEQINTSINNADEQLNLVYAKQNKEDVQLNSLTASFNQERTNLARLDERSKHNKELNIRFIQELESLSKQELELKLTIEELNQQNEEIKLRLEEHALKIEELLLVKETKTASFNQIEEQYFKASSNLSDLESQNNNVKQELRILENSIEHKQNQRNNLTIKLKKLEQETSSNTLDLNQSYFSLQDEINELEVWLGKQSSEINQNETRLTKLSTDKTALNTQLNHQTQNLALTCSRINTLDELISKASGSNENATLIDEARCVWQDLEVEAGYEVAVEIALADILAAYQIKNLDEFKQLPKSKLAVWISRDSASPLTGSGANSSFRVDTMQAKIHKDHTSEVLKTGQNQTEVKNSAFVIPAKRHEYLGEHKNSLSNHVKLNDSGLNAIYDILNNYLVIENYIAALEQTSRLSAQQKIVTQDGHILTKNFVIFNANLDQNHILEYKNQLETLYLEEHELFTQTNTLKEKLVILESTYLELHENILTAKENHTAKQKQQHNLQLEFTRQEQIYLQTTRHFERVNQELVVLTGEVVHISDELIELELKLQTKQEIAEELEAKIQEAATAKIEIEASFNQARTGIVEIDSQINQAKVNNQFQQQKLLNQSQLVTDKEHQIKQNQSRQEQLAIDTAQITKDSQDKELEVLQQQIGELALQITAQNQIITEVNDEVATLRNQIQVLQQDKEDSSNKLNGLRLKQQEQRLFINNYQESLESFSELEVEEHKQLLTQNQQTQTELQNSINQLQTKIEELGLVNLKAIEDLAIIQGKHTDLENQVLDLSEAITILEKAITQIDSESRKLLEDTYTKVGIAFDTYFKTLFGGGTAKLELTDADILNAGINIQASPPGKKNSSIHLLSGGEKA
jgi:chromosome segregation protein